MVDLEAPHVGKVTLNWHSHNAKITLKFPPTNGWGLIEKIRGKTNEN